MEYFRLSVFNLAFRKWKDIESFYKMKILSISRKRLRFEMKIAICETVQFWMVLWIRSGDRRNEIDYKKIGFKILR